jgi:hypothetical protein
MQTLQVAPKANATSTVPLNMLTALEKDMIYCPREVNRRGCRTPHDPVTTLPQILEGSPAPVPQRPDFLLEPALKKFRGTFIRIFIVHLYLNLQGQAGFIYTIAFAVIHFPANGL